MPEQTAPQKSSKATSATANKTLSIVIGIIVLLVILGGAGYYVQRQSAERAAEKTIEEATGGKVDVEGGKTTIETDEGKITVGGTEVPKDFPSDVTVYSGSEVVSSTEGTSGFSLTLSSAASVSNVFSFYKKDLPKNGWKITTSSSADGIALITAQKGKRSLIITAGPDEKSGKTSIGIVVGTD